MATVQNIQCPICYEPIIPNVSQVITPCNHIFCYTCFIVHITAKRPFSDKCPICREQLGENIDTVYQQTRSTDNSTLFNLLDLPIRSEDTSPRSDIEGELITNENLIQEARQTLNMLQSAILNRLDEN